MSEIPSQILSLVDVDGTRLLYCLVAVFAGAYLKGFTGFGASMLWMTSLSLVLPPVQVVPMVLMFEVVTSIALLPQLWKEVQWKSIGLLLVGTWVATPLGIFVLSSVPAAPMRMGLAVIVFVAAVLILRGFALENEPGRLATTGIGLVAGVLNGSMGIVGPPVILFYFSSPIGVVAGRASIIAYFIGTDSVGAGMFMAQGLIDESVYCRTAMFLPILMVGVVIGNRGFLNTSPETFKKVAIFVLMALSVALFAVAVWE